MNNKRNPKENNVFNYSKMQIKKKSSLNNGSGLYYIGKNPARK